jgi:hypothetical protein
MMAGAAIGKVVRRPWLAIGLAFASHFVLDIIPHLDSHSMFGTPSGGPTPAEVASATVDTFIGIALVLLLARRQRARSRILWAAFAAIVIDLVDDVPPWGPWFQAWPGTAWLSRFHHGIQHNVPLAQWPLGFGTQLLVLALAVWILLPRQRPQAEPIPSAVVRAP